MSSTFYLTNPALKIKQPGCGVCVGYGEAEKLVNDYIALIERCEVN